MQSIVDKNRHLTFRMTSNFPNFKVNIMSSRLKRDWCLSYYDVGNILHIYISHLRYKLRNFISQSERVLQPELDYWILKFPIDRSYGYWSFGGQFLWIFDQVVAAIRQERRPGQENVRRGCPGKTKHLKTMVIWDQAVLWIL